MSRFQKIFLASAFVVVGFAVAKFLGQPVLPTQVLATDRALLPATSLIGASPTATAVPPPAGGRIRLLPDAKTTLEGPAATSQSAATANAPRLGNTLAPAAATNDLANNFAAPRSFDFDPISSAPIAGSESTRARLRNEAPRPVGVDPQSPAAIRRRPTGNIDNDDPYRVVDTKATPPAWSAPPLLQSEYMEARPSSPTAQPASYSAPINSTAQDQPASQLTPPPWPMPAEAAEPRTHLVVDGDSLERLASRYLSDPQRSREIYELNREVLTSPDLLPIGAELKIPDRVASAKYDPRGFLPNSTNAKTLNEAGSDRSTQIQPPSSPQGIIPRAQLAPPVMVQ